MEDNEKKLENTIMGKIKSGQVKLKSRYIFLAEKLGLGTAFALSALLAVLFFNLILFYLKETDNLKYLSFGKFGIFAFLESFPYLLVVAFIVLIVLSGYLITKSDVSYKKPFGQLAVGLVVCIMVLGMVLTYTGLARNIEGQARTGNEPVNMFFKPLTDVRSRGIAGTVFEVGEDYLILQTPNGLQNVDLKDAKDTPEIEKGEFVIAVGNRKGLDFVAERIKIANKEDMPAVGRGIDYKFNGQDVNDVKSMPPSMMYFDKTEQECVKNCFDSGGTPSECLKECHK
jgi:hypothetical protein